MMNEDVKGKWFILGVVFSVILTNILWLGLSTVPINVVEYVYERPISVNSPYQNYSNNMVRDAINYSVCYVCNEPLFEEEHYPSWLLWKDYESRVTNASYTFWILSYSFGI